MCFFPFVLFVFYIILSFASSPSSRLCCYDSSSIFPSLSHCISAYLYLFFCISALYLFMRILHTSTQVTIFLDLSLFNRKLSSVNDCFFSLHFIWSSFVERLKLLFSIIVAVAADAVDVVHTNFVFMFVCFFAVQQRFDFIVALSCRYKIL